ncbi:hypothetical protein [Thiohalocapsa marina]|uniref:hypothetical protein n=1 Tax=Thiohalocapsa marina TaxID=424902 RepID=UPI0036DDC1A1
MAEQPDRGGRPVNLSRIARRIIRQKGAAWMDELQRAADLGDPAAIQTLLDLAQERPGQRNRET